MNTCGHCGGKIPEGASYCVYCGRLLDNVEEREVIPRSEYITLQKDREELKQKAELLDEIRNHGYAPLGKKLIADEEFTSMTETLKQSKALISKLEAQNTELNAKLNKIKAEGHAPSGKCMISNWILWFVGVVFAGGLGWYFFSGNQILSGMSDKVVVGEKLSLPEDLSGYYMVKEREGKGGDGVTAKMVQEGGQYAMYVYSSSLTRKYIFAYNSETGALSSEELGEGKVEYVGKINQIKISFNGWILVK